MVLVLAKLRTGPLTTSMPLSSDAFSCKTNVKSDSHKVSSLNYRRCRVQREAEAFTSRQTKSLYWGVEVYLQHHGVELFVLVQLPGAGEDGGGFARSRGAVEQQMRKPVLTDKPLNWRDETVVKTKKTKLTVCIYCKWDYLFKTWRKITVWPTYNYRKQ